MSIFGPTASHSAKFDQPGTIVEGRVTDIGDPFHATKFGSQEKDYWPSGDPIMNVSVTLQTTERDPQDPEDDGQRRLYVTVSGKEGGQLWAIRAALKAARQKDLAVGGYLKIQFTSYDPESKNQQNPRKLYRAAYTAPAGAFSVDTPPAQQATPPQQLPQQFQPAAAFNAGSGLPGTGQAQPQFAAPPAQDPWSQPPAQQQQGFAGKPPF